MSQSYVCTYSHIIFSTEHRTPSITSEMQDRLYPYMGGIVGHDKCRLLAVGGVAEHAHLLVSLHPQTALADLLRRVKANSSKWIHETFLEQGSFGWQDGYGAFPVSASNLEQVKRYIADQVRHHRKMSFEEEFVAFLKKHQVPFDQGYLWS